MAHIKPPSPEAIVRYIVEKDKSLSPALIADLDRWSAEISDDAESLDIDVTTEQWAAMWTIAGGALGRFLTGLNIPSSVVHELIDYFWSVGLWKQVQDAKLKQ